MNKWTRKRILTVFSDLVREYGYDDVTINMILEKAEIGKTTFYRYFSGKSDLLSEHYKDLYDTALADENCLDLKDLFTLLFRNVKDHPEELSMFDTIGFDSYREFIYKYTFERGKQIIEAAWGRKLSKKEKFNVAFFCGGGARILEEYACGKYRDIPPEEAGASIASMLGMRYRIQINKSELAGKKERK